jgi:tetratricopeptide (TPR) repeat protein
VAFVAALALFLLLSNQPAKLVGGGDAITTENQYEAARIEMEKLSLDHIKTFDAGAKLTTAEMAEVRKAGDIIDRMTKFAPLASGLFYLSGKIHHVLGEDQLAEDRYLQCTLVVPNDAAGHPDKAAEIKQEGAECSYQLSELLLLRREKEGAFAAADAAVKVTRNEVYLTARGSALNELGRVEEAKKDLREALKINPGYARAKGLLGFIERATSIPAPAKNP